MRIERLTLHVPAARAGEAERLGRLTGEALARVLAGDAAVPTRAQVRVNGQGQPAPLLARRIADGLVRRGG